MPTLAGPRPAIRNGFGMLALYLFAGMASSQTLQNVPVAQFDLPHYLGRWHEIARLPLYFERHCVADITATYTLEADSSVGVYNACRTADGKREDAHGVARLVSDRSGALQVTFAPRWLSWVPWVWADYWVIELDPEYRWAMVGSPSRKYLWILSRTPSMSRRQLNELRGHAAERGYDVSDLVIAGEVN